ncbi:MAG TPA: tRNA pseudouridine(54/55) synthase Pus10 [Halobacteriales archaeon]|nr:tRNA pseudouridine(54/55) synthase Pus10 [Halobacteriales archaeon]
MDLLESARAVLAEGPICDACLGRVFAARSHGLGNAERGKALRVTLAMVDDEPYEPTEDEACWVCEGQAGRADEWATWAANELADVDFSTYQVGTRLPPLLEANDELLREEAGLDPEAGESLKRELNREVGKRLGEMLGGDVDFERPDVVVLLDVEADRVRVQVNPAFVYGRYRKLERGIPQTVWPCRECDGAGVDRQGERCDHCGGTGYMYEESVESLVAPAIREAMDGTSATFHGAGREDVDALMLGTGRPFVVEVERPADRFPDVEALEATVNERAAGKAEVEGLALATYEMVERVKELPATKTYRASVRFAEPVAEADLKDALEALSGATIEQRTPERVSHRRADKVRTREVFSIEGELDGDEGDDDGRTATVTVHGEGGLYIKELLHGDDGRTEPSLAGLLGVDVEVTALDVISVEAEEGEFADPAFLRSAPS